MNDVSAEPLPTLPARPPTAHKGDFGRAVVVGGSLGMAGAPALAAMACLRSGAGLVSVATPRCVLPIVAAYHPAYMTVALPCDGERLVASAVTAIDSTFDGVQAAAIGPGLGGSPEIAELVVRLYTTTPHPLVIDADGLNALAGKLPLPAPAGPRVLTPHAGEFARLSGSPLADPNDHAQRQGHAASLARTDPTGRTVVVLKGHRTVTTTGSRYAVNETGNPGMATGGSGDVLTGVILALLAQRLPAFDAARLAVHTHGLAGDLAADRLGQLSMTATDILDALPDAWRRVAA